MNANKNISRRDLLATAAASLPLLSMASNAASATAEEASGTATGSTGAKGMNVVIFLTDQQRKVMHFRVGWEQANLPGMTRLKRHGLSFENAFTNACMCSPARATLMSGYFPAQTRVKYTLEQSMKGQPGKYPQFPLPHPTDPLQLKNIATVMSAAGYDVIYKGKWHLDHYQGARFVPFDVNSYGFQRWDPQDAGANQN
jgi:arylsulfatase A-like enzyme